MSVSFYRSIKGESVVLVISILTLCLVYSDDSHFFPSSNSLLSTSQVFELTFILWDYLPKIHWADYVQSHSSCFLGWPLSFLNIDHPFLHMIE